MEADLLELEHVFGFTGRYLSTALYHPTDPNFIVYCIGGLVVLENIHDKNSQYFLRGHDNDISALAISPNGLLIASGQIGSPRQRNNDAPVILWSYRDRRSLTQFSGPLGQVTKVSFSPDGMFLAAISDLGVFMVWDCRDGSTVYSKRTEVPMQTFCWGSVTDSAQGLAGAGKHPSYQLIAYYSSSVLIHSFDFDIASMTYRISTAACQLPSSGLNRTYTCSTCDSVGEFTIAGTSSGELCVFSIPNRIFRASLPLSSNGLLVMIELDGSLYVGSGDGKVKRIAGRDTKWNVLAEAQLPGRIISMSPSPDRREILCGTSLGCIFRLITSDLTNTIHSESPIGAVRDVAFGFRSDMFL
jgi:WD40 repeat protein